MFTLRPPVPGHVIVFKDQKKIEAEKVDCTCTCTTCTYTCTCTCRVSLHLHLHLQGVTRVN
jgi:hypothetical protein